MTESEFPSLLGRLGELTTGQVTTLRQAFRRGDGFAQVGHVRTWTRGVLPFVRLHKREWPEV